MGIGLEYECTYQAELRPPLEVGKGPRGNRMIVEVIGGRIEGKRINGKFLTGGADWLVVGDDGFGRLDVRAQLQTHDGAVIYVTYTTGILEMNASVQKALETASGTDYADHYFRTNPVFETGDPRYAWMNQSVFVAEGHLLPGRIVEYKVYRLT